MGTLALFDGKVDSFRGQRQLSHPSFTTLEQDATDLDVLQEATRLFAIYPASAKCSSEIVRKAVAVVLDQLDPRRGGRPAAGRGAARRTTSPARPRRCS